MTPDEPTSRERRRLEAVVLGRVQGVGFRFHVARAAARHRIVGWVANEPSGAVRAIGEGTQSDLRDWLAELWAGPSGSSVSRVDEVWSAPTNRFDDFEIRAGWNSGG